MAKKQAKKTKERKPSKLEIAIKENPTRAIMIGLGVLLLIRVGLFLSESSPVPAAPVDLTPIAMPTPIDVGQNVINFVKPKPEFEKEKKYEALAASNIFDPKQVMDPGDKVRQAEKLYNEAQVAFETWRTSTNRQPADLERARKAAQDALGVMANHRRARDLLEKRIQPAIDAAKTAAANAATSATQPVDVQPPAPPAEPQ